ncbi:putative RNA-binding domain superfamily [Helianthus anomalus]
MEGVDDGGPWVGPKVKGVGSGNGFNPKICKFFVSNIPKGCRLWDLANAFRVYGDIGVHDVEGLEARLVNMKLGGYKLLVNVARFAKENEASHRYRGGSNRGVEGRGFDNNLKFDGKPRQSAKVYKEVSNGKSFWKLILRFLLFPRIFGRALAGRTRDFSVLRKINVSLKETGFRDIEIQYLGGLTVLLSFVGDSEAKKFAEFGEVWTRWFVQGDDEDLTFDCIGILADSGNLISGFLKLRWQDKTYRVWVTEEPSAWVPDCTGNINLLNERSSEFALDEKSPLSRWMAVQLTRQVGSHLGLMSNRWILLGILILRRMVRWGGGVPMHVDNNSNFLPLRVLSSRPGVITPPPIQVPGPRLMIVGLIM